jgi:flavin reductase (DIM6/NTAB) family NADH-FMN oxidoreductase RutF
MINISVRPERHSYRMIEESGCFSVNIPGAGLAEQVDLCGILSGRDVDKFERSGLTAIRGSETPAPLVAECPVNIECRLTEVKELGVHHQFSGRIVAKHADPELVSGGRLDLGGVELLAYVNGEYRVVKGKVGSYGCSSRK